MTKARALCQPLWKCCAGGVPRGQPGLVQGGGAASRPGEVAVGSKSRRHFKESARGDLDYGEKNMG